MHGLNDLLNNHMVWRARDLTVQATIDSSNDSTTGFPELDAMLLERGWPNGALIEILGDKYGIGELRLLAPSLIRLEHTNALWTVWINPPYLPYAPALEAIGINIERTLLVHPRNHKEALWAIEESLNSGSCGALIAWLHEQSVDEKQLRRIQWRSKQARVWSFLFRPTTAARKASPAVLRLKIDCDRTAPNHSLRLSILKRPGGWSMDGITLDLDWNPITNTHKRLKQRLANWRKLMTSEN